MALESGTYIDDFVATNPTGADDRSTADDHLRLVKSFILASFPNITGAMTATQVELNKLVGYTGDLPELGTVQSWTKQQYFAESALTDATSIAWVLDDKQTSRVTLAGNRTLDNPTTLKAGGMYLLRITQDATGSRTLAYGTVYKFPNGITPVLTTAANSIDILSCVSDGTNMYCNLIKDLS